MKFHEGDGVIKFTPFFFSVYISILKIGGINYEYILWKKVKRVRGNM